ncbi:unnamed protein product, partial [Urochloa humidicola]
FPIPSRTLVAPSLSLSSSPPPPSFHPLLHRRWPIPTLPLADRVAVIAAACIGPLARRNRGRPDCAPSARPSRRLLTSPYHPRPRTLIQLVCVAIGSMPPSAAVAASASSFNPLPSICVTSTVVATAAEMDWCCGPPPRPLHERGVVPMVGVAGGGGYGIRCRCERRPHPIPLVPYRSSQMRLSPPAAKQQQLAGVSHYPTVDAPWARGTQIQYPASIQWNNQQTPMKTAGSFAYFGVS